ncbi:helix-turn-helix domain-containing protein [Rhizobium brockwellii]|uniref:helix-turn-helix domain-containing protein n=1 Tax=Rhizobium brockwellii TaxID=3019932 RepID=UPI003F9B6C3B
MVKPRTRSYSRYSRDAVRLLGQSIRLARIERKLTIEELAERAGLSRGLVQRIERGDMGCAIGAAFEAAAIVGIRLFDVDQSAMTAKITSNDQILTLLPQSVRNPTKAVKDDF